jgi:hypothetical protein
VNTNTHAGSFSGRVRFVDSNRRSFKAVLSERVSAVKDRAWDLGVVVMERVVGTRRDGEGLDVHLAASARDLVTRKGRAVKGEMEWLAQAVQNTGSYQAKEEAARALHSVMDALGERVPADLMLKLCEHLPPAEAERLRAAVERRR